eukprot:s6584_g3.t1
MFSIKVATLRHTQISLGKLLLDAEGVQLGRRGVFSPAMGSLDKSRYNSDYCSLNWYKKDRPRLGSTTLEIIGVLEALSADRWSIDKVPHGNREYLDLGGPGWTWVDKGGPGTPQLARSLKRRNEDSNGLSSTTPKVKADFSGKAPQS